MKNFFCFNLKKLSESESQRDIAEKTGVSASSINNYLAGKSDPSASFLLSLKKAYGVDIDDFLCKEMTGIETKRTDGSISRFVGNYIVYYFDASAYKGRVNGYVRNTLSYGVVSVLQKSDLSSRDKLTAFGRFLLSRKDAEELLLDLNKKKTLDIEAFYENDDLSYSGELVQGTTQFFLTLKNISETDIGFLIFNNPPSPNKYVGGIGTANSVSRGRECMPCIQYMIFSRNILSISDGEIYNMLELGIPNVDVHIEAEQLIGLFKNLYTGSSEFANNLSDIQKKKIVEDSLENIMSDLFESNMFRFAKVSNMEDDKCFRLIRDNTEDDEI